MTTNDPQPENALSASPEVTRDPETGVDRPTEHAADVPTGVPGDPIFDVTCSGCGAAYTSTPHPTGAPCPFCGAELDQLTQVERGA